MWNNKKQQKMFSLMSNLQTYYHFKLDFQKSGQTYRGQVVNPRHQDNCPIEYALQRGLKQWA